MELELTSRIIANTRRSKRLLNLVQIANDIENLVAILGSTKAVAQAVMLSQSMIGQFLAVLKLCPEVKELVENRSIDSVSNAFYLSKFKSEDQKKLAEMLIKKQVDSSELRLILPLRNKFKNLSTPELVQKLQDSKNKKISVIKFEIEEATASILEIRNRLLNVIGEENLVTVEQNDKSGVIRMTPEGEKQLRQAARKRKQSLQDYTYTIIY